MVKKYNTWELVMMDWIFTNMRILEDFTKLPLKIGESW
jgi:hypothetical protein